MPKEGEVFSNERPEQPFTPSLSGVRERAGGSRAPDTPTATASNKPRQIAGAYPVRRITYYQFSNSDLRSIGVAQGAATLCAAIGTWAMSSYFDLSKDIALAEAASQKVPEMLASLVRVCLSAWIVFWCLAFFAFLWQGSELRRIKVEHGELSYLELVKNWWRSRDHKNLTN